MASSPPTVRIPLLHANDVYRVRQKVATPDGPKDYYADQFVSRAHAVRRQWPAAASGKADDLPGLSLFSGDVFNPSVESVITRGEHMICVLNAMKWDAACPGNHDFDGSTPLLQHLISETNFPWVFSNVVDTTGKGKLQLPAELGDGVAQLDQTLPWWTCTTQGVKVGIVALVEQDWISTIPSWPPEYEYRDMVKVAKLYSSQLRKEHGCELVIALTHSRLPNDIKLALATGCVRSADRPAEQVGDHLDLILGGHDHFYYSGNGFDSFTGAEFEIQAGSEADTNAMILKSGTDFRDLSEVWLEVGVASGAPEGTGRSILKADVTRIQPNPIDDTRLPGLDKEIDEVLAKISKATDQPIATTLTPWDCRSEKLRTEETAIGDFISDICLTAYDEILSQNFPARPPGRRQVDVALLCGGAIRSDTLFPPGKRSIGDVLEVLPFSDSVVVIELSGEHLLEALETSLSKYPEQEGRFPVIGGMAVKWDSRKPPGQRVLEARLLQDGHLFSDADGAGDGKPSTYSLAPQTQKTNVSEFGNKWTVYHSALELGPPIDPNDTYRVVSREYMVQGFDGFDVLTKGKMLIDDENGGLMMSQLVRKYFMGCSYLLRMRTLRNKYPETPADSAMPSRSTTPATSTSALTTPNQSSTSLSQRTGRSTELTPLRPIPKDAGGHLRVPNASEAPGSPPHEVTQERRRSFGSSLQSLTPSNLVHSIRERSRSRSRSRETSPSRRPSVGASGDEGATTPRKHRIGLHRPHQHHAHHHRHHLHPHRPRTPHHGFPATSRARQALERWLRLDSSAFDTAPDSEPGTYPTTGVASETDANADASPKEGPSPAASRPRSPSGRGKELWAQLRQAVVDNSVSGRHNAFYIADAEVHDDPIQRMFTTKSKPETQASAKEPAGPGAGAAAAPPPESETAAESTTDGTADSKVLAESVTLDKHAAAELADQLGPDSKEDANLAVVAPLTDGRLVDVARAEPTW